MFFVDVATTTRHTVPHPPAQPPGLSTAFAQNEIRQGMWNVAPTLPLPTFWFDWSSIEARIVQNRSTLTITRQRRYQQTLQVPRKGTHHHPAAFVGFCFFIDLCWFWRTRHSSLPANYRNSGELPFQLILISFSFLSHSHSLFSYLVLIQKLLCVALTTVCVDVGGPWLHRGCI